MTPMSADTFEAMMASKNAALGKRMDCDRKWPELDLFLPVNLRHYDDMIRKYEFMTMFYRSYVLFWNKFSNTSLNVLVDAEDADDYNAIELKKYDSLYTLWACLEADNFMCYSDIQSSSDLNSQAPFAFLSTSQVISTSGVTIDNSASCFGQITSLQQNMLDLWTQTVYL